MNKIIKNTIKIFVITLVLTFGLLFAQKTAQAFPDAYVTSYNVTTYQDVPVYSECYWVFYSYNYTCNINPNKRKPGGGSNLCVPGGHWVFRNCSDNKECWGNVNKPHSKIYYSSCDFNNAYCANEPWHAPGGTYVSGYNRIDSTVTNYICHYISAVNSWTPCSPEGVQVATSVTWSTVSGTSCSNVPLVRSCVPPPRHNLNVSINGSGSGWVDGSGISCGSGRSTCSVSIAESTSFALNAHDNSDSIFTGWLGCPSPSGTSCSGTMGTTDINVTATFAIKPKIDVTISGCGTVKGTGISPPCASPGGTKTCSFYYNPGTSVTLTANADDCDGDSHFGSWIPPDCSGSGSCTLTMNGDKKAIAYFPSQKDCSCDTEDCRSTCIGQPCDDSCGSDSTCKGTLSCPLWQEVQP